MKIYHSLAEVPADFGPCALTIGNFDGVHFGHRRILRRLKSLADGPRLEAFGASPSIRIPPGWWRPKRHASPADLAEARAELMREEGMEQVLILPFTRELAVLTSEEFAAAIAGGPPERAGGAGGR